jgi:hypothetical protein
VLVVLAILVTASQASSQVWVASSLVRVGQFDPLGSATSINLSAARGETVSTQVIVRTPSNDLTGLTNLNISASALTGPGGASIPASSITLYREYYVTVQASDNVGGNNQPPSMSPGTYAEPLIPFYDPKTGADLCLTSATLKACKATTAAAGQNQPYWIDIFVPRGAANSPRGTYTGTISVTADQGSASVPVTLTVWNFELPLKPSELTHFTLSVNAGNPSDAQQHSLTRNRVFGMNWSAAQAASFQTSDGLNRSSLGETFGWNFVNCNGSLNDAIPSQSAIASAAATYPADMPLELYVSDETIGCSAAWSNIQSIANNAHGAGVKTLDTVPPDSHLYNYIDYWVMLPVDWPSSLSGIPGSFWSYTSCNVGNGSTPRWDIDFAPINERQQAGFLNYTQGATGLLYYTVDGWSAGDTPASWNNLNTSSCGVPGSGDGMLLYPPSPIGSSESAPGIRLKAIRDGVQDYEYAQILYNLGYGSFVSSTLQPIAGSWNACGSSPCWSQDPTALENARIQLGQQIDQLNP